jgi:hypothetical protein
VPRRSSATANSDRTTPFVGDEAIGLIDWTEYVRPGSRLFDFGHAVWFFVPVGQEGGTDAEQARPIRIMCDAYGCATDAALDAIEERFRAALSAAEASGRRGPVRVFGGLLDWLLSNGPSIRASTRDNGT